MAETYIPLSIRQLVLQESKGLCEYCLSPAAFSSSFFHFDHIIPTVKGGASVFKNLAYSCSSCNGHKFDKTHYFDPLTLQSVNLYHPRLHQHRHHFQWSEDDLLILGITATGRATIELLQLNRIGNINLRSLLKLVGLHPPEL